MNEGQLQAVKDVLKITAGAGMIGAAGRTGLEVLRQMNPRYNPPETSQPILVTIPRPVAGPVPALTPPKKVKELPAAKVASFADRAVAFLDRNIPGLVPPAQPWFGPPDAKSLEEIPARYFGYGLAAPAGAAAGYFGADKLLRAADRRRAKSDLDAAQKEYQESVIGRARTMQLPEKSAADVQAILESGTPVSPAGQRLKAAIDRAYAASQILSSTTGLPPAISSTPLPAPAAVGAPGAAAIKAPPPIASTSIPKIPSAPASPAPESSAPEKIANDDWPAGLKALQSWLYPYGTIPGAPETSRTALNYGLMTAGLGAGTGALVGYSKHRDEEKRQLARKAIRDVDQANASKVPAPLIARIVPYQAQTA